MPNPLPEISASATPAGPRTACLRTGIRHPHLDASGRIAVVHNGVIENYDVLKQRLIKAGHKFTSDTDTEVLAHLIGDFYEKRRGKNGADLSQSVCDALREVIGTYGIG